MKRCDPSLTRAMPERFRDDQLIIKRYTNKAYLYLEAYTLNYVYTHLRAQWLKKGR